MDERGKGTAAHDNSALAPFAPLPGSTAGTVKVRQSSGLIVCSSSLRRTGNGGCCRHVDGASHPACQGGTKRSGGGSGAKRVNSGPAGSPGLHGGLCNRRCVGTRRNGHSGGRSSDGVGRGLCHGLGGMEAVGPQARHQRRYRGRYRLIRHNCVRDDMGGGRGGCKLDDCCSGDGSVRRGSDHQEGRGICGCCDAKAQYRGCKG